VWMVYVGRMLSLCNCDVIMALQMTYNQYFCIMTLQLYQSLISLQSVLKRRNFVCIFVYSFVSHSNQRGLCAFLIILISIYVSLLLLAAVIFTFGWFVLVVFLILR
jgi:hypothetical protein